MACRFMGKAPMEIQKSHDKFWGDNGDQWCTKIDRFVTKETCEICSENR